MTQAIPEVKNTDQAPQNTIETNGNGVPSAGHNENISNEAAVAETVADVEVETGAVDEATQELETDPNIVKVETFAPKPEIHPEVAEAGVTAIDPHTEAEEMNKAAQTLGGQVVGHETPTSNLGQTIGEFNKPHTQTEQTIPEREAFKATSSGQFAKGDGAVYKKALFGKWKEMLFAKVPKLFAGSKTESVPSTNISEFPTAQQQQEVKKAA